MSSCGRAVNKSSYFIWVVIGILLIAVVGYVISSRTSGSEETSLVNDAETADIKELAYTTINALSQGDKARIEEISCEYGSLPVVFPEFSELYREATPTGVSDISEPDENGYVTALVSFSIPEMTRSTGKVTPAVDTAVNFHFRHDKGKWCVYS